MINILNALFLQEFRFQFRSPFFLVVQVANSLLVLTVFWFTSKALGDTTQFDVHWQAHSYFEYLLLGEMVLLLPLAFCDSTALAVRYAGNEGLLEDFFLHPRGPLRAIVSLAGALILPQALSLLSMFLVAVIFFSFSLPLLSWLMIAVVIACALPLFLGLSLLSGALLLTFGRGDGAVRQVCYIATVFAGAYFPLTVLSPHVQSLIRAISPFALVLESCRQIALGTSIDYFSLLGTLLALGIVLLGAGLYAFNLACLRIRKGHWPLLAHP